MKVHVIGLGATAKDFKPDGNTTIGVNQVKNTDVTVCVDSVARMRETGRMYEMIAVSGYKMFTQFKEWNHFFVVEQIELKAVHAHAYRWNQFIPSSNNSPFVACGVAYKFFNATEIYLWGVDFHDHPHITGAMRDRAVEDYKLLQSLLNRRGCKIIPHPESYLFGKI